MQVLSVDPGFETRDLLSARLPAAVDPRQAIDGLVQIAGVETVAVSL